MSEKIKKIVSQKILDNLESFEGVWSRPWFLSQPNNPITGTKYSGVNRFTLGLLGKSGQFVTYKQAQSEGGQVKQGAKSLPVVFYAQIEKKTEYQSLDEENETFFMMRYYNVFDLEDCEGLDHLKTVSGHNVIQPLGEADSLVQSTGSDIRNAGGAYYSPTEDYISIPLRQKFKDQSSYYSTLFHELTHWTGHSTRLKRFRENYATKFASNEYAFEELVAELGSCMFLQHFGILDAGIHNSKAYLKSWWSKIKEKPEDLFNAVQKAHKAYQFITKTESERE